MTSENILWVYVDNLQDPSVKIKILSRNAICKREERRGQVCFQDSAPPPPSTPSHTHTMVGVKWTGLGLRTKSDPSSHLLFSGLWCLLRKCLLWVIMETFKVPELQGKMACVVGEVAIKILDNICGVLPSSRALLQEIRILSHWTLLPRLTQFSSSPC